MCPLAFTWNYTFKYGWNAIYMTLARNMSRNRLLVDSVFQKASNEEKPKFNAFHTQRIGRRERYIFHRINCGLIVCDDTFSIYYKKLKCYGYIWPYPFLMELIDALPLDVCSLKRNCMTLIKGINIYSKNAYRQYWRYRIFFQYMVLFIRQQFSNNLAHFLQSIQYL